MCTLVLLGGAPALIGAAMAAPKKTETDKTDKTAAKKPKYYFNVIDVEAPSADAATKASAKEILSKELAGRPEFTSDLEGASTPEAVAAELKRRGLQGFKVTLKIESLTKEPKPPRPGGRLKQLAVGVKVSVFGTTLTEEKLAFGGDGEAMEEAEVVERRMEEESAGIVNDVMAQAVKQAVDQAVAKLSQPKAKPLNESKRRKK